MQAQRRGSGSAAGGTEAGRQPEGGSGGIERAASSRTLPVQESRFDGLLASVLLLAAIAA